MLAGRGLRRFPAVNRLHEAVLRLVKSRETDVMGHRMLLDSLDSLELSVRGVYEPLETRIAIERIRPGACVVDIGANIGYYTLQFARAAGPGGVVHAFEPEPENFRILSHNVRRHSYSQVRLNHAALSCQAGEMQLYLSKENHGDHRLGGADCSDRESVTVQTLTLDRYFGAKIPKIDLLKMDIQGAEGLALRGMRQVLAVSPPQVILSEFWPAGMERAGADSEEFLQTLAAHRYRLARIDQTSERAVAVGPNELAQEFTVEKGNQTNLLAWQENP